MYLKYENTTCCFNNSCQLMGRIVILAIHTYMRYHSYNVSVDGDSALPTITSILPLTLLGYKLCPLSLIEVGLLGVWSLLAGNHLTPMVQLKCNLMPVCISHAVFSLVAHASLCVCTRTYMPDSIGKYYIFC